eukprot:148205-Amphidinium_carterae.1
MSKLFALPFIRTRQSRQRVMCSQCKAQSDNITLCTLLKLIDLMFVKTELDALGRRQVGLSKRWTSVQEEPSLSHHIPDLVPKPSRYGVQVTGELSTSK